jgi:hypothetical protein
MRQLFIIAVILAACSSPRRPDEPLPPIDPTRLSHAQHGALPCDKCHRPNEVRPGVDDHKPCDDPACHRKDFLATPGKLCLVCHESIKPPPNFEAKLKKYPRQDLWQSQPPVFSHKKHMDADKMEDQVGFHVACNDCHVRDGNRVTPSHAACARCHAAEVGLAKAPPMEKCDGCHQDGARPRKRVRLIRGDLEFSHERHVTDRKNQPIRCEQCHQQSAQSSRFEDHPAPRVESCVGCHDDSDRTPITSRMRICETCHRERVSGVATLAPRNHLPASERPIDHTIAFRRDHREIAARESARCATCHTQMSGNAMNTCDECHQTMLPTDHRITWRELDHGPEATATRDRCATCHVVEFCTSCHAQRPRSHGFRGTFTTAHGRLARANVRSCLTCHVSRFDNMIGQPAIVSCADCHEIPASLEPDQR